MANFKRKRPKEYTIHICGYRHCSQDKGKFRGNGRDRYLTGYWKKLGGRHAWRYGYLEE
jgi:hypothetical protein